MKIYRDGQAIELTPKEIQQAYEEQRDEYFGEDVCDRLQEEYNINPNRGDVNWEEIALIAQELLADNDMYNDIYWDAIHTAIKAYLKGKGIK